MKKKKVIGLTGEMGTGKSTVFKMLIKRNTIHGYHAPNFYQSLINFIF